jgi:hypothetical protein
MTSTIDKKTLAYSEKTIKRAERAIFCSPFNLSLFAAMQNQSVPLPTIADRTGVEYGYTQKPITETNAEAELIWSIEVGLLRREVDGQGLTDSFRLTPLGRYIVTKWQDRENHLPTPSWGDRIFNWLNRWLKWTA